MPTYIDNTNLLRVTEVNVTALDGTTSLSSLTGEFTVIDSNSVEVTGQTWPTSLTLNTDGDYTGVIESDVDFIEGQTYTAVITIGTDVANMAEFNHFITPRDRTSQNSTWVAN